MNTKQTGLKVRQDDHRCESVAYFDRAIAAAQRSIAELRMAKLFALQASQYGGQK